MQVEDLDRIAALCSVAERAGREVEKLVYCQRYEEAEAAGGMAADAAGDARLALEALGAQTSGKVSSSPVPFHLLDTPDVRALLGELERLLPLAMKIDQARGRVVDTRQGPMGLDVAEALGQLVAKLALDVRGPAASVTGGRE